MRNYQSITLKFVQSEETIHFGRPQLTRSTRDCFFWALLPVMSCSSFSHKSDCNKVFLIPGYSEGKLSCQELSVSQAPRHSLQDPSDDNVTFPLRKDHQVMTSMSIRSLQPPVS